MDLEEFYEADPRRRHSEELEFGHDWTDGDVRCGISWIAATGELYVMREPYGQVAGDVFGDEIMLRMHDDELGVEVLGVVANKGLVEAVMSGWDAQMNEPNSLAWVRARVANQANETADPPGEPSEDLDAY